MAKGSKKSERVPEIAPVSLGQLIHTQIRGGIEAAVHEELAAALGAAPYERSGTRREYRNGVKARMLTGPTGPLALTLPRGTLFAAAGEQEWTSALLPRYQRRVRDVNEVVVGTYLTGDNTRRIRRALQPLLKATPLSKSAVSPVVATLENGLPEWMVRSLAELDVIYLRLDALALRVRSAGKVVRVPVLTAVAVLADGQKQPLALELCSSDGNAGLRRAVERTWPWAAVQRCCVHKLRNLERKAPKHALDDLREDFHRIVYAASDDAARTAYTTFERTWAKRCPGVVRSLQEGGEELLTFFSFPKAQRKTLRTTSVIERLNEEFRRRVKTQGSRPSEDAAVVLLFSLVASGQIKLRRIDGWRKIATVLSQHTGVAA